LIVLHALRSSTRVDALRARLVLLKPAALRSASDRAFLRAAIDRCDSIGYAKKVALGAAAKAKTTFEGIEHLFEPSCHLEFLRELTEYVTHRIH